MILAYTDDSNGAVVHHSAAVAVPGHDAGAERLTEFKGALSREAPIADWICNIIFSRKQWRLQVPALSNRFP